MSTFETNRDIRIVKELNSLVAEGDHPVLNGYHSRDELLFVLIGLLGLLYFPIASCSDSSDQTILNTLK